MTTATNDKLWMLFPWALLGTALAGLGLMASLAAKDPSFSLEKDYYQKATTWEAEQAQRAKNARLGWSLAPTQTADGALLTLRTKEGEPVAGATGEVEAFAIVRGLYRYDPTPLDTTTERTEDSPAWRRETVTFNAPYGNERIIAHIFLPKAARPPYQTVIYFQAATRRACRRAATFV